MSVLGRDRGDGFGRGSGAGIGALSLALVSVLLLLSSLYAAQASVFQKARESALTAASPILEAFSGPIGFVSDVFGRVEEYFFVLEQNKALREQVEALRHWEHEARDLSELLAGYEALGLLYPPPKAQPINAVVVGESGDAFNHSMILNAGRDAGVARGQAVVDDRGLVGRVVETAGDAARVLLLTDVQSNIPVFVEGSGVDGILVGRSTARPVIEFTRNDDLFKVAAGQRVVTSGAGGTLPRGLVVGAVAEVGKNEAAVELDANYARTRVVRVINYEFPTVAPDGEREEDPSSELSQTLTSGAEPDVEAVRIAGGEGDG